MPTAWPDTPPTAAERAAYAEAVPRPFWLDRRTDPVVHPALDGRAEADLCIVGGGFTGLSLGATPTAIANMTATTKHYGPSPNAFIILPLVSAFFVDLVNVIAITLFLST